MDGGTYSGHAMVVQPVEVCDFCVGEAWELIDFSHLAYFIAIIALGQVQHVANILSGIEQGAPVFAVDELKAQALEVLTVPQGRTPWRRDGFLFEAISWIAARQTAGPGEYLRDPHLKSTSQGLDGLLIKVVDGKLEQLTIFEDKCSENPRDIFRGQVMKAFQEYHQRKRSSELLAAAGELLRQANLTPTKFPAAAAAVLDHAIRRYRASLAVHPNLNTKEARAELFDKYNELKKIELHQRLGAVFRVPSEDLRDWCEKLAEAARTHVKEMPDPVSVGFADV